MSRSLSAGALKLALATAVALVSAGGALAATAASASPHAAVAKPPPVDHQLCYRVTGTGFKIPPKVVLKDQFNRKGFRVKIGKVVVHCNPVKKILPDKVFPITNPNAHLACFRITAPKQATPTVIVTNQFGRAKLRTGQPNLLCLPSWKSLTGPPRKKAPQPPGLSHFTCYPVRVATGSYQPPPNIMLQDQFAPKPVPVKVNRVPAELCLSAEKIVGKHVFKIVNAADHLLCFPVTKTPIKPRIWDQNQFGTAKLAVQKTNWLCLPSKKTVVHN